MARSREITIFVKLISVPALVVMSATGVISEILDNLTTTGHSVRKIGSDTIVIEEKT